MANTEGGVLFDVLNSQTMKGREGELGEKRKKGRPIIYKKKKTGLLDK